MSEYEVKKKYTVRGVEVDSEVMKDQIEETMRSLVIRSSCASVRWGVRTQDHSYSCSPQWGGFVSSFEHSRKNAAETLVLTEQGDLAERGVPLVVVELIGPNGTHITPACAVNLSFSASLLSPEFIELLQLEKTGEFYCEIKEGAPSHIPLFRGTIKFGELTAETSFLPASYNGPVVLGGDFFQKALHGNEGLITELIMPDHFRTLMNAARCKKRYVLILGSYGEKRDRLGIIKEALKKLELIGLILDEYPDIEEQSLTEKMVTYASICRFVIVDDIAPSGHIKELSLCHDLKFVSAVLRLQGRPATAMQADVSDEVSFIKEFKYADDVSLASAITEAALWATSTVGERAQTLNRKYSTWRSPTKIMG